MFKLANDEWNILKSQFATSSWGGVRELPYVFGEHGVLMLSTILNSDRAIQVNILTMRVFTNARKLLMDTTELRLEMEKILKQSSG